MFAAVRKVYNYYWSKDKVLARELRPIIGFIPSRLSIFKLAFYHRSMQNDNTPEHHNNERLEYLGDAILSTIVAEYLFKKYPFKDEGFLTKMRSKIVKRDTLNGVAEKMGLDLILTNYSQGRMSKTMLGNALEALVGALYIEFGYKGTKDYVIKNILMRYLDIHELEQKDDNYKSRILEWSQKENKNIEFKTVEKSKVNKRDRFKIAILVDGEKWGTAEDFSKKAAEQKASRIALSQILDEQLIE